MENISPTSQLSNPTTPSHAMNANPHHSPNSPTATHDFPALARHGATSIPPDQPVAMTPSGQPALNPRSCVTCRKRKVRCDKQMPCSNCRRAVIQCIYPAPGRAPRRPRPKDPNAPPKNSSEREVELMKRLRKLEGIVEDLSGQIEVESGVGSNSGRQNSSTGDSPDAFGHDVGGERTGGLQNSSNSNSAVAVAALKDAVAPTKMDTDPDPRRSSDKAPGLSRQFGRLVLHDKGRSSRYVSSAIWSKLNDELDKLRDEMHVLGEDTDDSDIEETPDHSPEQPVDAATDHHSFILGYRSSDVDLRKLHPLPSQIPFMWQIYQENVEPLLKILHIPTMEKLIRNMRRNIDELTPGNEALLFSIYYAAITSMEDEEACSKTHTPILFVEKNFGSKKEAMLSQYRFALEQALAKANFLNTSDMVVLQAFVLFLTLVRREDDTRFCWTLTGLAIRIAQGLGIHRDGTNFGLPPFETEMRRRLWWAICTLDLRSAEELGSDLTIIDRSFDTELPSNVNDADIEPGMTKAPTSRWGKTDCAVSLVRYEICTLSRRLHTAGSAMAGVCPRDASSSLEDRERMLIEVYDRVEEKFLQHCFTDDDPLFWMAAMIARVIMAKMSLVIYQPMLFPGNGHELSNEVRDRLFLSAIEVVEYNYILNTDPRCKQWRWLFQTYRQWHAIAYILMEAGRRPWSATSERGWEAVNNTMRFDRDPAEISRMADHMAVWVPLRKLSAKATKHREAEIVRLRSDPDAARQLDVDDRMNPIPARLGPVPGMETKHAQIRARWRNLVRTEGCSPVQAVPDRRLGSQKQPAPYAASAAAAETVPPPPLPVSQQNQPARAPPASMRPPREPEFIDTVMMARGFNPNHIWEYLYPTAESMAADPNNTLFPSTASQAPGSSQSMMATGDAQSPTTVSAACLDAEQRQRQQAIAMTSQPTVASSISDNQPPWLWSDPFTSINNASTDAMDVNMDNLDDFNWQNWQESIKGFEMDPDNLPQKGAW
ncbi:Fungal specific transcription factor domain-containing protein [Colletotrichum higginsianum IMI 349063]|uniref:Fungal specific transcription factor domain-containing protein n=2 Tax=Colletotrichum higginsianum (strain IMI 349063) TaxID=759273 RepID=A0A1B7YD44_COLHI|nr:Fungal specific transcription factor domain-containing protein [Colletotrichum higginsianum IMI 349063]OBR09800.1 Fungal specific transcription factor domain-containing protein [Colletotrichum higginsianum IMI 349063]